MSDWLIDKRGSLCYNYAVRVCIPEVCPLDIDSSAEPHRLRASVSYTQKFTKKEEMKNADL